ncbi:hypothetical protein BKA70DRAFT_1571220 [Coprinopsis sp. MPI-PUGE-AT-0042]|nr:hypothetical protein BKA70DRAFT_1571220 [Coprinopsis sp. MPI-PUGE-AT-0042]
MVYRWYSPQLIVRHWQATIAPQQQATMKIPPVRSIDVQACEILFMRHMHWPIVSSLSSPYLHRHFLHHPACSTSLLGEVSGRHSTQQSLSPLRHRRGLMSVFREVDIIEGC